MEPTELRPCTSVRGGLLSPSEGHERVKENKALLEEAGPIILVSTVPYYLDSIEPIGIRN